MLLIKIWIILELVIYMKKNGFTLIELLITISILLAMGLLLVVNVNSVRKNHNISECKRLVSEFETAAEVYNKTHDTLTSVTLNMLNGDGLIKDNLINPVTNEEFDYNTTVSNTYEYSNPEVCE